MALKYRFNLKDIKLEDFKVYLFALFKAILPKKKNKEFKGFRGIYSKEICLGFTSYFVWIFKNQDGH